MWSYLQTWDTFIHFYPFLLCEMGVGFATLDNNVSVLKFT